MCILQFLQLQYHADYSQQGRPGTSARSTAAAGSTRIRSNSSRSSGEVAAGAQVTVVVCLGELGAIGVEAGVADGFAGSAAVTVLVWIG